MNQATLQNDLTDGKKITAGDAVVYHVELTCPAGKWCNFDTVLNGDPNAGLLAVGARFVHSGSLTALPPSWASTEVAGDALKFNFGPAFNGDTDTTTVVMEISYRTDPAIVGFGMDITVAGDQTVGLVETGIKGETFPVAQKVSIQRVFFNQKTFLEL